MALMEKKKHRGRRAQRRTFRKRSRTGLFVFVGLVALALGLLTYIGVSSALGWGDGGGVERVEPPVVEGPPEVVSEEPAAEARAEREAAEQQRAEDEAALQQAEEERLAAEVQVAEEERAEAEAAAAPEDPTMYLTVPALGIQDVPVINDSSEAALEAGAQHLPNTGFPWEDDSNVYIAGHRLGYPGTASDHVFYSLPNMSVGDEIIVEDANGTVYTYAVTEFREVSPTDTYVVNSEAGRDMISLQTCTEDFGDYWTEGPNWFARYIVVADRVS